MMIVRLLLSVLGFFVSACAPMHGPDDTTRSSSDQAIVGGILDVGDPAVIEVLVNGFGECTGTLISPRLVLTAAHCVAELPQSTSFGVFLGPDDSGPGDTLAASAFPHPSYSTADDTTDIAVMLLDEPLEIAPVAFLRTPLARELIGEPVRIVGYGDNTVASPSSGFGVKREATAALNDFDDEWVYVGDAANNQCFGDSGGPALMMIDGVETIIGVDSWSDSEDCDVENANTKVDAYVDFIEGHLAAAAGDGEPSEDDDLSLEREQEGEAQALDDDVPPLVGCAAAGLDASVLALVLALRRRR